MSVICTLNVELALYTYFLSKLFLWNGMLISLEIILEKSITGYYVVNFLNFFSIAYRLH